jgi:hypothetical protein
MDKLNKKKGYPYNQSNLNIVIEILNSKSLPLNLLNRYWKERIKK